jgi:pimeloyl-ACP methyl ester carboxylesterase
MFLNVNGVRLHVVEFGSGDRTILAVGGWTGSWEMWEETLGLMSTSGWRCIAFDHRGSGESPVEPELITVQNMVDDIIGVMDQLAIETFVLAGESSGAAIAQLAAAQYPDRISGLILVDSASTDRAELAPSAFAAACRNNYSAAVEAFVDRCVPEPDSDHIRRWGRNLLMRADPEQAARLIEMWQDDDVPEFNIGHITQPTLIIHGTEDVIVSIESSRKLNKLIPGSKLVELSGCGHVPTMTRPKEVYEQILKYFPPLT